MLTQAQRDELDAIVEDTGATLGEVTRALLNDGLAVSYRREMRHIDP
jgi:hypothetical protein